MISLIRSVPMLIVSAIIALTLPCVALAAGGTTTAWSLPTGTILPGAQSELQKEITGDVSGVGTGTARVAWLQATFLANVAKTTIAWSAALAVVFVIIGAYQYFAAMGDTGKVETGTKTITWALAGLVIMLLSYAIVQVVTNLNFNGEKPTIDFTATTDGETACEVALTSAADPVAGASAVQKACSEGELAALEKEYFRTLACATTDVDTAAAKGRTSGALMMSRVCMPASLATLQSTFESIKK